MTAIKDSIDDMWGSVVKGVADTLCHLVINDLTNGIDGGSIISKSVVKAFEGLKTLPVKDIKKAVSGCVHEVLSDADKSAILDSARGRPPLNFIHCYHDADLLALYDCKVLYDSLKAAEAAEAAESGDDKKAASQNRDSDPILSLVELAKYSGWMVAHQKVCWASDRHSFVKLDNEGRLHCDNGPSIAYSDGFKVYSWRGTVVPRKWIEDKGSLSAKEALGQENAELRRSACEILGWHNILKELDAKTINADKDPQVGKLVEVNIPDAGLARFLLVLCGTGREFALPVPNEMRTAIEAQAWTWGLDTEEFVKPEVRT